MYLFYYLILAYSHGYHEISPFMPIATKGIAFIFSLSYLRVSLATLVHSRKEYCSVLD